MFFTAVEIWRTQYPEDFCWWFFSAILQPSWRMCS